MPNAYILNDHLDAADRAIIEGVIQGANLAPVYGVPKDFSSLDQNADVGVVGLPIAPEDEVTVNARMQAFAGVGIRVVCIWLHDEEEGEGVGVPNGVGKYGITVDVSSTDIAATLQGKTDVWEKPGGAPSPLQVTKRNKC